MPLKIRRPAPRTAKEKAVLEALIAELRNPRDSGEPIITERHMPRRGLIHVQVLWDRWQECREAERFEIIHDAYKEVKGEEFAGRIILATGVTRPEAASTGLLPVQLLPRRRDEEEHTPDDYTRAMIEEGAFTRNGSGDPELRFETLEDAEACQDHLERRLPGSRWSIVQHEGGVE
ncbi:MAG TPA: hypothetical protein VFW33_20715 [Gemmataceae bacterium]|nr:hypothetical protein [Gemmataceae bacterium]